MSSLSDDMIGSLFLWPNSLPPEQALADQATLVACEAAAQSHRDIITKCVAVKPMMYEELLTSSQHEQLVDEVCTCFKYEELHLTERHQWLALKPTEQQWIGARQFIQHWNLTMKMCGKTK